MTVAEAMPAVRAAVPGPSQRTYFSALRLIERELGNLPVADVTTVHLRTLRDDLERRTGVTVVARAQARGRALHSYDPRSFGQGAASNLVMAARFFFRYAVDAGWVTASPATTVSTPRRHPSLRRPLTSVELDEIWRIGTTTGMDAELDKHILTFLRHTACRRGG